MDPKESSNETTPEGFVLPSENTTFVGQNERPVTDKQSPIFTKLPNSILTSSKGENNMSKTSNENPVKDNDPRIDLTKKTSGVPKSETEENPLLQPVTAVQPPVIPLIPLIPIIPSHTGVNTKGKYSEIVVNILKLICYGGEVTDLHLKVGDYIWFRDKAFFMGKYGNQPIQYSDMVSVGNIFMENSPTNVDFTAGWKNFSFGSSYGERRLRIQCSFSEGRACMFIRILPGVVPQLDNLNYPQTVTDAIFGCISNISSGLVVCSGVTGSGKSTLLAAMLQEIVSRNNIHLLTIEDPIEYRIVPRRGNVTQKEVGVDVSSFEEGSKFMLRENPDIIMIGEIRDANTAKAILSATETGHMVFSTVHGGNFSLIIERLLGLIDGYNDTLQAIRLSQALNTMISIKLVNSERKVFIQKNEMNIKNLIKEHRLHELNTYLSKENRTLGAE